jgi:competence protein ComEA
MMTGKYWTPLTIFLIAVIAVGSIIAWSRYVSSQPAEITISHTSPAENPSEIYIGGAVSNPGRYPLKTTDDITTLIRAAGGTTAGIDYYELTLHIPEGSIASESQKIDLNHAEAWLLQALPGIGETRAEAIIAYRNQHGPFRSVSELTRVVGIGDTTYQQIEQLITVAN